MSYPETIDGNRNHRTESKNIKIREKSTTRGSDGGLRT